MAEHGLGRDLLVAMSRVVAWMPRLVTSALAARVPSRVVPSVIELVERLPRTAHGKVGLQGLAPRARFRDTRPPVALGPADGLVAVLRSEVLEGPPHTAACVTSPRALTSAAAPAVSKAA